MATSEALVFDAAGSNVDGTDSGSPLIFGPGTPYGLVECAYPAPPLNVQYASSIDSEGELPVSQRYGNRTVTLKFKFVDSTGALLTALQAKYGKLQREGGTLKRTLKNGDVRIYDVIAGDGWSPVFDFGYYIAHVTEVEITLPARPLSRGAMVTLSPHTASTKAPLIFTESIPGDAPALGSLLIDNVTNAKTWGAWGSQSRYYDAAAGAALLFESETGQLVGSGVADPGFTGASGGGANKVVRHSNVGTVGTSAYVIGPAGSPLQHVGLFRVWARVQASSTNTGIVSSQLWWKRDSLGPQVTNDWVPIVDSAGAALEGAWVLVNLGEVRIPLAKRGTQRWSAEIYSKSTVAADDVDYDWVAFVPCGEGGSGVVEESGTGIAVGGAVVAAWNGVQARTTGTLWFDPIKFEGSHMLIPPAGPEARTLRMLVMLAGPTSGSGNLTDTVVDATNLDAITATLSYWPRYLT